MEDFFKNFFVIIFLGFLFPVVHCLVLYYVGFVHCRIFFFPFSVVFEALSKSEMVEPVLF